METTPMKPFYLGGCLYESKRIFRDNYRHFFVLSFLFLPFSLSLIINPTLSLTGFFIKPLVSHLFYITIVDVLALCAIATITYSTYHGYSGKPVKFFDAVKFLTFSCLPLLWTVLVALVVLVLISLTFLVLVGVIAMLGHNLGFVIKYSSLWFSTFVGAMLCAIIVYFLLNWYFAVVVVVAESKWGFEALIRSSQLVKGMRSASLSLLVYFGIILGCAVFSMSDSFHALRTSSYALLPMTLGSSFLAWFLLWSTAANTVLYIYCKDFHGELAADIADGSAHNYINLPSDDQQIPHVVTVVEA